MKRKIGTSDTVSISFSMLHSYTYFCCAMSVLTSNKFHVTKHFCFIGM